MHQPDNQPRHSLYYRYQVYPAAPPPKPAKGASVLVVGAGPIGLALALDLARYGVGCVVVESQQQVCEGSRAIVFTRRSMEILQQVGGDLAITRQGLPWRFGSSFYRGHQVFRMEAPKSEDDRFFPMINLQQQFVEQALVERVLAEPLIELRWGHAVTGVKRNDSHGAELEIDTPEGPYLQRADWVVACDGARSTLRQLLGLKMEGASYEGRFVIADIRIDLPFPTERRAYFDPSWNPGNTVLMHREPHGLWRIDYQLPEGESPEQALEPASLMARIDAQLDMVGARGTRWQLDWCSVYSARAMTLGSYVHQRICLAGDAAHLLPIFGVRGANTGWQDGQNLAWKLACTVKRVAGPGLLDSYTQERVAASREIIDEAGKSTRFMTPPSRGFRLLRDATLSLSIDQAFVRPLFHWRTSRPHDYLDSHLNAVDDDNTMFDAGPPVGAVMGNVKLGADSFLMDDTRPGFVLLSFGAGALGADVTQALDHWRARGVPLLHWEVMQHARPAAAAGDELSRDVGAQAGAAAGSDELPVDTDPDTQASDGPDRVIHDAAGRVWDSYGVGRAGAAYLLRPDQHVVARWINLDAQRLNSALARALARH
ncbi:MAG: FAD-dependent monooxygenase [Burkholderiales bacterium]|nr:FAD-dependent monooxygenase [Burkholderiales bacterium]